MPRCSSSPDRSPSPSWGKIGSLTQPQVRGGGQGTATCCSDPTQPGGTAEACRRTSVQSWFGGRRAPSLASPSLRNSWGLIQEATGVVLILSRGQMVCGRALSWSRGNHCPSAELGTGQGQGAGDP